EGCTVPFDKSSAALARACMAGAQDSCAAPNSSTMVLQSAAIQLRHCYCSEHRAPAGCIADSDSAQLPVASLRTASNLRSRPVEPPKCAPEACSRPLIQLWLRYARDQASHL